MTTITCKRLTGADDLRDATSLLVRFFREEGFETNEVLIADNAQKLAKLDVCGLFVAEADGLAVGVATVSLDFGIEYGWSAEMGDLYVLPDWRGRGVAKALTEILETFLRSRGVAGYEVTLTPYASSEHQLEKYYTRFGFEDEGRIILWKPLR